MTPVQRLLYRYARRHPDPTRAQLLGELLADVYGCVVEVGCGDGSLFPNYPTAVTDLIGIEPDSESRDLAVNQSYLLAINARVEDCAAGRFPVQSASADFVVCHEVLCSVTAPDAILVEIRRVLSPRGVLCIYEHVCSEKWGFRLFQHMVDLLGWPFLVGGCHTARDTVTRIEQAGFEWVFLRRIWSARMLLHLPTGPHILGRATRRVTSEP
jgi:SAM-dependent methyltransferase